MADDVRGTDVTLMRPQVTPEAEEYANAYTRNRRRPSPPPCSTTRRVAPHPIMAGGIKEARLLQALVRLMDARRIEYDDTVADVAQRHFEASPDGAKIALRRGDARDVLPTDRGRPGVRQARPRGSSRPPGDADGRRRLGSGQRVAIRPPSASHAAPVT